MNAATAPAKRGKLKLALAESTTQSPIDDDPTPPAALPPAPEAIALRWLRRAPENVRHTRPDEDVQELADDMAKHGLLQSLIGYREVDTTYGETGVVMIVGGGRRLQALQILLDRFTIAIDYPVPVLIRDRDDAIELSLAENLQQRTMSPVDEFLAFRALMDLGSGTPADLAKRFGWEERKVQQRLRLAQLAPVVLDALANREIALDAAMAYAGTQDQKLQAEVYGVEKRKSWEPNKPANIRHSLNMKRVKADDQLFTFVGEEAYEARGGRYEDDLFLEELDGRILANPFLLVTIARERIELAMFNLLPELQKRKELTPTISGFVPTADLRKRHWGNGERLNLPKGWVKVEKHDPKPMWALIASKEIEAKVLVGVNDAGEIEVLPRFAIVRKADQATLQPPAPTGGAHYETEEQRAAREKEAGILRHARRLAVGPFTGTIFEGRAYWSRDSWYDRPEAATIDGVEGTLVTVRIFVTDEEVKAQRAAGEAEYQAELDAHAAEGASA